MATQPMPEAVFNAEQEQIRSLLQNHIERRQFGIFGEPRVNVLELNLALDKQLPLRAALR